MTLFVCLLLCKQRQENQQTENQFMCQSDSEPSRSLPHRYNYPFIDMIIIIIISIDSSVMTGKAVCCNNNKKSC